MFLDKRHITCMVNSGTGDDWIKAKTQTEVGVLFSYGSTNVHLMCPCSVLTTCSRSVSRWSLLGFQRCWIIVNALTTGLKTSKIKFVILLMGICCASMSQIDPQWPWGRTTSWEYLKLCKLLHSLWKWHQQMCQITVVPFWLLLVFFKLWKPKKPKSQNSRFPTWKRQSCTWKSHCAFLTFCHAFLTFHHAFLTFPLAFLTFFTWKQM